MASTARTPTAAEKTTPGVDARRALSELHRHPQAELVPEMDARAYEAFLADVRERGIQVPLDVTEAGVVVDGRQRLRAAAALNLSQVPVRIVAPDDEVEYLCLAAIQRRQLNAGQVAVIALELDSYRAMRAEGESRRLASLKQNRGGNVATSGKTRARIAKLAGISDRTVQDAIAVYDGDPDLLRQVKEGRLAVHTAAARVRRARRDAGLGQPPRLPDGLFDLILADPPWRLGATDTERGPDRHYPTMPLGDIAAMELPTADDALLFLWAADGHLPDALQVMKAWGFEYVNSLIWVKEGAFGLGAWVRNQHEQLLIGKRGKISPPPPERRFSSVIDARRGEHSEKPACAYERIERMYPDARKLELFARASRQGWTVWGNEAPDD